MNDSQSVKNERRIRTGGYRALAAFQLATIIYDATVEFCNDFIDPKSRLVDQMVQAARSGRQNIAEGSRTGSTNLSAERHLTNVARASLEELLLDYEDYLRQKQLPQWNIVSSEAANVRMVWNDHYQEENRVTSIQTECNWRAIDDEHRKWYDKWLNHSVPAAVKANALICLIHQANYRLDLMLFPKGTIENKISVPLSCGVCGSPIVIRTVKNGPRAGQKFWGCSRYPKCTWSQPCKQE